MNILYLSDTGDIIGGGEFSLIDLLKSLDRSEFNPCVVMPFEGSFSEIVKKLGVPVEIVSLKKIKNPLNIFASVAALKQLSGTIKKYKIDLVHSNSTGGMAFLGSLAAKFNKTPFVWHVRTMDCGVINFAQGFLATKIVAISKATKKKFWWLPSRNKILVIYNGVDLRKFNIEVDRLGIRKSLGCGDNEFLVGTVGRYHAIKGYKFFIKAAGIVLKVIPRVKFFVVGLDYDENNKILVNLRKSAKRYNLEDKITFLDKKENTVEVISSLDVFVLPSLTESFGRVLVEAMAAKKPIVSFNVGGVSEVIEDGRTGILVKSKDYKMLAEKIIFLLQNPEMARSMGDAGRRRCEELFDLNLCVKIIQSLYKELRYENRDRH
ncbi:MAG: glycosyltransferase [Candidatus Omnitrophica bacterium]|nr:glycosyltransferase [Candidatus Omnitrophota bacterium]